MDNKLPTKVILPQEAENKRHELRAVVQRVQTAFLSLKNDSDFTMPDWQSLSAEYVINYFSPLLDSIKRSVTIDNSQKQKLLEQWERKKKTTLQKTSIILNLISSSSQLEWKFDSKVFMPVPSRNIDEVANEMATVEIDNKAQKHWHLLLIVVDAYKTLRSYEQENHIGKKPLEWLFRLTNERFAEEWAARHFDVPEAPDQVTAERWRILQKNIF